jgi:general stress protein YciG
MTAKKDFSQVAFDVVQRATGEVTATAPSKKQESGRKGGLKGGASRAIALTPEQRSEIARVAAQARWKKA